jgi:hypothetical protein
MGAVVEAVKNVIVGKIRAALLGILMGGMTLQWPALAQNPCYDPNCTNQVGEHNWLCGNNGRCVPAPQCDCSVCGPGTVACGSLVVPQAQRALTAQKVNADVRLERRSAVGVASTSRPTEIIVVRVGTRAPPLLTRLQPVQTAPATSRATLASRDVRFLRIAAMYVLTFSITPTFSYKPPRVSHTAVTVLKTAITSAMTRRIMLRIFALPLADQIATAATAVASSVMKA